MATTCFAQQKTYVISYSPGTVFHSLVRDRVKVVYERAGLSVEFVPLPHKRSLQHANEGLIDAEVGRIPNVERKYLNLRRVNVNLINLTGAAYVATPTIEKYSDDLLDTEQVGIVLGVQWCQKKMQDRPSTKLTTYDALFEMLLLNRVNLVLATTASAESVLYNSTQDWKGIRRLEPPIFTAPIYHYVHKKNEHLIPLLEQTIRDLQMEDYWGDAQSTKASAP